MTATNNPLPATWPDNTKLPHPAKVAAIKTICAQSRQSQPLPAVWPERAVASKKAVTQ